MTKQQITYGLLALAVIGVIILLIVLFSGKKDTNQDLVKQLIAAKDSVIKKENEKAAIYERLIDEKEQKESVLKSRDSVLQSHYNEKDRQIKFLNETIRNIPARINRIANNPDSIARAFADF
jgi:hypothetical protein